MGGLREPLGYSYKINSKALDVCIGRKIFILLLIVPVDLWNDFVWVSNQSVIQNFGLIRYLDVCVNSLIEIVYLEFQVDSSFWSAIWVDNEFRANALFGSILYLEFWVDSLFRLIRNIRLICYLKFRVDSLLRLICYFKFRLILYSDQFIHCNFWVDSLFTSICYWDQFFYI